MGIFRRPRDMPSPPSPAIAEFWEWWDQARPRIEAVLNEGLTTELVEELSLRVHKIHSDLQWEIGSGQNDVPTLTLSGGGIAELRGLAERWLRTSPARTNWEL